MKYITTARLNIKAHNYKSNEFKKEYASVYKQTTELFERYGITKIKDVGNKSVSWDIKGMMECETKDRNNIINKLYKEGKDLVVAFESKPKTGWF